MSEIDISLDFLGLGGVRLSTFSGVCISDDSCIWQQTNETAMQNLRQAKALLPDLLDLQHLEWVREHNGELPDEVKPAARAMAERIRTNVLASDANKKFAIMFLKGSLPRPAVRTVRSEERRKGYVYVLKGGPYYKIGCTCDPQERFDQIQPQLPFETEVVCLIATEDMHKTEAALHKLYADKRANGEWFELDEADVALFKEFADGRV